MGDDDDDDNEGSIEGMVNGEDKVILLVWFIVYGIFFYIIVCFNWIECSGRLSLLLLSFSFIDNIVIFLNVKKFRNPRYNDVLAD